MHISDGPAEVFGIGTAARYRTSLGLVRNNTEFGMSAAFWRCLPDDLQRILHAWLHAEAQAECQVFYGLEGARAINSAPPAASSSSFPRKNGHIFRTWSRRWSPVSSMRSRRPACLPPP